jgi:hypothetical protein
LGIKAIEAGYRVLFSTAANRVAALTKAHPRGAWRIGSSLYHAQAADHRRNWLPAHRPGRRQSVATRDPPEVCPLSRRMMSPGGSIPVRPITGRPSLSPASFRNWRKITLTSRNFTPYP